MSVHKIKIGVVGAGKTGKHLIAQLAKFDFIQIVMVADIQSDSPGVVYAKENGIPVTTDFLDILKMGMNVDLIVDVTGRKDVRMSLRHYLQETGNKHTVIVPELVAILLMSMAKGELVDSFHGYQKYE